MYTFMNTDMNKYLIFGKCMGMLINYHKKNDCLSAESLMLGKHTRHLCLQSTFLVNFMKLMRRNVDQNIKTKAGMVEVLVSERSE